MVHESLILAGAGIFGVFFVLVLFYFLIKVIRKLFPDVPKEVPADGEAVYDE